jgi:hypothetical protein
VLRVALFAISCLAGCGRLGFEERNVNADAAGGSGGTITDAPTGDASTASFGSMEVGISTQNTSNDRVWVSRFTLTEPAAVQQLVAYFAPNSGQSNLRGVIYADASGTPTSLLGSTTVVLAAQAQPTWVPLPFAAPVMLSPGDYWIGTHTATAIGIAYQSNMGASKFANDLFSDGTNATYTGSATTFTLQLSIYAEYTR